MYRFLASAVSSPSLQQTLLPTSHTLLTYTDIIRVETAWSLFSNAPAPEPALQHIQKAWNATIVSNMSELVFAFEASEIDLARLKADSSPHSADWLHAPANCFDWSTTFGRRHSPLSGTAIRSSGIFTLYARMWQTCRCQRPPRPILQRIYGTIPASLHG